MKDWRKITLENYNKHAKQYAFHAVDYRGKLKSWIEKFANSFHEDAKILDLGCGAGRDAFFFSEKGLNITGIDFSDELIKLSRKKVKNGKFIVMDFEQMDFQENTFDGIWASASLLHLPRKNLLPVLQNIHAFLKKNGLFFLLLRVGNEEKFTHEQRGDAILERFYAYWQPKEIRALLKKTGFSEMSFELDTINSGDWFAFFARK